jgi:hypothetical protein
MFDTLRVVAQCGTLNELLFTLVGFQRRYLLRGMNLALKGRMVSRRSLLSLTVLTLCNFLVACSGAEGPPCPRSCPAAGLGLSVAVTTSTGPDTLSGVEVTVSGPTPATLSCEADTPVTYCFWPGGVSPGTYTLDVSAPGHRAAEVTAVVTVTHDARCGCDSATLEPSKVTLDPA